MKYCKECGTYHETEPIITAEELDAVRDRMLKKQRKCGWCDKIFPSWQELCLHIEITHKEHVSDILEKYQ